MYLRLFIILFPLFLSGEFIVQDAPTLSILSPVHASRKTQKLILDNDLHVYLISDPSIKQSAAALCVGAGSWDDPKEHPGMAHFLEHMLFMGSRAYPQENDFQQFIHDHGGNTNAYTAFDRTVYAFSVNHDAFAQAVDRFAHFFIDPLLSRSSIDRELYAVNQEHAKNIENDAWRMGMILKETSHPDHPYHNFNTGNADTLSSIDDPSLRSWMETHYSAHHMNLVFISAQPLETLHELACSHFTPIQKTLVQKPNIPKWAYTSAQMGHMFFIKPIKEQRNLTIIWEFSTPFSNEIDAQTGPTVAALLQSKDHGCLHHWLKKQKLAFDVSASWWRLGPSNANLFLSIELTEYGLSQVDIVVQSVFQAIARGLQEGIPISFFEDLQKGAKIQYQFPSNESAFEEALRFAGEMPYENLTSFPQKSRVPTEYNPVLMQRFLAKLTPERAIYTMLASPEKTGVAPVRKEKWMGAEYAVQQIDEKKLARWRDVEPHPDIVFPSTNPFLPNSLHFCSREELPCKEHPLLLSLDPRGMAYFAQDRIYGIPETTLVFHLRSPAIYAHPKRQALLSLYLYALQETLAPISSQADVAGMQFSISPDHLAIKGTVQGYSETFAHLAHTLFSSFTTCSIDKETFALFRDDLVRALRNKEQDLPVSQAAHTLMSFLFKQPTNKDMAKLLAETSYEEYQSFTQALFEKTYLEATFYGNLTSAEALDLYQTVQNTLSSQPFPRVEHPPKEITLLAQNDVRLSDTARQGSGVVLLIQQGELTSDKKAVQLLLSTALEESFFHALRTQQQTCYIARAWAMDKMEQLMQFFAVQSSTHSVHDLLSRFEQFLNTFTAQLAVEIPKKRFENMRANVLELLQKPQDNMSQMAKHLHTLAFTYMNFSWNDWLSASLSALTYEEFLRTAHTLLSDPQKRLAILVRGHLPEIAPEKTALSNHSRS